jgi:phenylalanine-4-hydroxylase
MNSKNLTNFQWNEVTKKLPIYLHEFIVKQPYEDYTAQDHAIWRYVMRLNLNYLPKVAHHYYLDGIERTGITIDRIPEMEGMNRILKDIGWAAVSVDGFIPPNAFMEFQAYNVLVIASDIRNIDQIAYTPAPDIIHEAAGHAPIIGNPEYAEYLRRFGEIGSKAISSPKDYEIYEAVRKVSILKEDPEADQESIENALMELQKIQENMGELSEMAQLRNLHWWTVEYGLIGTLDNPKIYGAGLLSSIEESKLCLLNKVEKRNYTIDAAQVNFDITKTQPQLFVTPNFAHLSYILEKFADKMALRTGGLNGVEKLIESKNIGTVELSTGLQISGLFSKVISFDNKVIYIQTLGQTALASREKELNGHSIQQHPDGFGSPIGKLENTNLAIEDMSPKDLEIYGICEGKQVHLHFEGGINVCGEIITGKRDVRGKIILISFKKCTVTFGDMILFKPEWGIYDMAVGKKVISAFAGPACPNSFNNLYKVSKTKSRKPSSNNLHKKLYTLYEKLRFMRENSRMEDPSLLNILNELKENHPKDWLLCLEMYELVYGKGLKIEKDIQEHLNKLKSISAINKLISDGIQLIIKQ